MLSIPRVPPHTLVSPWDWSWWEARIAGNNHNQTKEVVTVGVEMPPLVSILLRGSVSNLFSPAPVKC